MAATTGPALGNRHFSTHDGLGCSFAFNLGQGDDDFDEEDTDEGRCIVRSILNFSALHDVSVVTHPAYPGTNVDARNIVAPVELRSRLQRKQSKRSRLFASFGNASAEDAMEVLRSVRKDTIDEGDALARRRNLMNFILS